MHSRFGKVDGFIRFCDGTRYLVLLRGEKYDFIYNRIRCLIEVKSGVNDVFSYSYAKIKVDSYDSWPLERTLTFHDVIIHIKSVWNKDQNHYYYNISLKKFYYQLPKNNDKK